MKNLIVQVTNQIQRRFQIEEFGDINYYLGITIKRESSTGNYFMNQKSYIEDLCKKFNISFSPTIDTPLPFQFKYDEEEIHTLRT